MIETARLLLRVWREEDAATLHAIRTDPRVTATLGPVRDEPDAVIERQNAGIAARGYGFWAIERRADGALIGWCGVQPGFGPIEGHTEIGWTIVPESWGQGLAREAATAVLAWTWTNTGLNCIVAITTPGNSRSRGLMERLGMTRVTGGDFDHPALAESDPLRRHLTYAIERP